MIIKYGEKQLWREPDKQPDGLFLKANAQEELPLMQKQWREKLQVIYLDPPFFTGKKFSYRQKIGEEGWKGSSKHTLTHIAYSDNWESRESFLSMLRQVLSLSHVMLKPEGSLFLHLDYRFSSYARLLMDEIFGQENFLNEIIWAYQSGGRAKRHFSRKHDTILFYRKSNLHFFNVEAVGKPRGLTKRNNMKKQVDDDGKIFWSIRSNGKEYRYYEDSKIYPSDVWDDISHLQQKDPERTGYETQKPEALLERILLSTSSPGDWVGDFFAGSGTTLATAQRNGRRWIGMDIGDCSVNVCRKRLLQVSKENIFSISDPSLRIQKYGDNKNIEMNLVEKNQEFKIQLLNYQSKPIPELIHRFSDYIDYWSVGNVINGEFIPTDQSYRTMADPKLKTTLTVPAVITQNTKDIAVHIIDIYGKQSIIGL